MGLRSRGISGGYESQSISLVLCKEPEEQLSDDMIYNGGY
jgi:hypothetical protein